jgi:hypothetical protein
VKEESVATLMSCQWRGVCPRRGSVALGFSWTGLAQATPCLFDRSAAGRGARIGLLRTRSWWPASSSRRAKTCDCFMHSAAARSSLHCGNCRRRSRPVAPRTLRPRFPQQQLHRRGTQAPIDALQLAAPRLLNEPTKLGPFQGFHR